MSEQDDLERYNEERYMKDAYEQEREQAECLDEELTPHLFNSRTPYEPGDDRDIWCKDCEYHRDHPVHAVALFT